MRAADLGWRFEWSSIAQYMGRELSTVIALVHIVAEERKRGWEPRLAAIAGRSMSLVGGLKLLGQRIVRSAHPCESWGLAGIAGCVQHGGVI